MATQVEKPSLDDELLDRLLVGCDPETVLETGGLLGEMKKALAQRMLNAEMDVHLGRDEEQAAGNHIIAPCGSVLSTASRPHA
ncbi:MAG TPA: hypothetical protein VNK45_02400 [Candidatus Acidoferrales bacterium]|nr:hypothetical protein [Candidatus Acidoferrales bacterium]